jgi:hypothetical protein
MRLMLWMTVVRACLAWDNVTQVEAVLSSACPCMGVHDRLAIREFVILHPVTELEAR